ncbi:DNA primase [Flavitalea sp. BT771]|uniref:DNA primase n=1 Tax=Flavitalea sp. BT771 TaxID=3063329 RepID=UPI0026E2A24A|nr:DNA primase [Flavitalea sp. BT771]MDO6434703.1 DNA primase [Flavitalea sp. BT771]MDV6223603.1 DNA primase [Flavitalea sp. BT771]
MISQQTIQQILSRIDIIEVVGGFVRLKKRGTNYLGLCPFHNEKSPSFTVSPVKEIYKCFGCGRSGNTISFLMEHEKYSYAEALRWLAAKYNVEIEEKEQSPEVRQQQQVADSLYILNGFAQKWFHDTLLSSEEGQDIGLSYLRERGFNDDIIRKFQLGYSPEQRDAFARAALAAQYNLEYLQKSGLVVVRDERPLDNYRGRIIFPIHSQTGKTIGFGARIIKSNDRAPKYINTPENEIYIKSKILYGSWLARQAIDKQDECLLVEGYTDVVSLHQAGVENVVASGGTSLTVDQLRLIKKYTNHLTIIYDGDGAGIKAALRGLDMALEESLDVKLVLIPDREDPDSYVRKVGAAAFREFVATAKKDFILFQLEVALKDAAGDTTKRAEVVNQVAETIARINKAEDFTKRQDYIRQCSEILRIEETGLHALVNKFIRERIAKQESKAASASTPSFQQTDGMSLQQEGAPEMPGPDDEDSINLLFKHEQNERGMIRSLLDFGLRPWDENTSVADYILAESSDFYDLIDNRRLVKILDIYKAWYEEGLEPTVKNFLYHEDQELSTLAVSIMDFHHELSLNWKEHFEGKIATRDDLYKEDVISTIGYLKLRKIKRLMEENQQDLSKPHTDEEQMVLLQTHIHLKQLERDLLLHLGTVIIK